MPFTKGHTINVGIKRSNESKERYRLSKLGDKNPMFGKLPWNKGIPYLKGEENPAWKGAMVGYRALHAWIRKHLPGVSACTQCDKNKKLEVSNTGIYDRDFKNWEWLCKSCHRTKDKTYLNLGMMGKKHSRGTRQKFRDAWIKRKIRKVQMMPISE